MRWLHRRPSQNLLLVFAVSILWMGTTALILAQNNAASKDKSPPAKVTTPAAPSPSFVPEGLRQPTPTQHQDGYRSLALAAAEFERHGNILKKVVRQIKPTVVHIEARKSAPVDMHVPYQRPVEEAGSGVIVTIGGKFYVLTNRHVISRTPPSGIKIGLSDGRVIQPTKTWSDPETDIAVMAVNSPRLLAARLGNSNALEIGDYVLAVGSPFGLSHSVTYGIISAKGRRDLRLGKASVRYQDFMQTDAAINPGNSGGPLINLRGEVIGINTAIASNSGGNEGIGFTIPINMVKFIAAQLVQQGHVSHAFLGVHLDPTFTAATATKLGLLRPVGAHVTGITPESPAADTDLKTGDVLLRFNNIPIDDDSHLVNLVSLTPIGTEVTVSVFRAGKVHQLKVRVGDRSQFEKKR